MREADIMKKLSHPHILTVHAICTEKEPFYIVMEFMTNGSVLHCLTSTSNKLKFNDLINIGAQVVDISHICRLFFRSP